MLKIFFVLSAVLALFVLHCSAAVNPTAVFYDDEWYAGTTKTVTGTVGTCYSVSPLTNAITAFNITNSGAVGIQAFSQPSCAGPSFSTYSPIARLGDGGVESDTIQSFKFVSSFTPAPTPATPVNDPTYGVCQVNLIVDYYVYRNLSSRLTAAQVKERYVNYFADVQAYYFNHFDIKLNLSYVFVDTAGLFKTPTGDLNDLQNAIANGIFPGAPTQTCLSILIHSEDFGAGGYTWGDNACYDNGVVYVLDRVAQDGSSVVIRRLIHEVGHTFHGAHSSDYAAATPSYACSTSTKILRATWPVPYTFLIQDANVSQCAELAIKNSLQAFTCLYTTNSYTGSAVYIYLTDDINFSGSSLTIQARRGLSACYNPVRHIGTITSFSTNNSGAKIYAYEYEDCRGTQTALTGTNDLTTVGWNDRIRSFKFSP